MSSVSPANIYSILYRVTGSAGLVTVTYLDDLGKIKQLDAIPPWETDFPVHDGAAVYLFAINKTDRGEVIAEIYLDGKILKKASSSGVYASAKCSAQI